jgi:hypothetical protein
MPPDVQYCFRKISKTGKVLSEIITILLFCFLLVPVSVNGQQLNYDEVSITLNVQRVGNTEVSALISDEELFVSVKDVFDYLKIKNSFTPGSDSLAGFIAGPKDIFLVDKVNNTITYNNSATLLKQNEIISTETGLYLKASYFGKIFGLGCKFNFRNLSAVLSVKADLPLLREMQQELIRKNLSRLKEEKKPDTTIGRKFSLFQLGMADWMVTATQEKNSEDYTRASIALGGVLAGGEADIYANYSTNYGFDARQQYFKWRYVNNDHSALRQITIGRISVPVISTLKGPVTGIQLSNTPTTYRRSFGTYTMSNTTKPGWIVELYVDNVLINYTKADASGFFTFEVPMMYGNSVVKLRFYGPSGEESSQDQMVSVPFSFLPQRKFEYNIAAGNILDERKTRFSKANFNYGLGRSVTIGGGAEYLSSRTSQKPFSFVNTSLRLGNNIIVSAEQAQGVRTKGTLNYRTARNLQLQLNYAKYKRNQYAVITPYVEERSVVISFPYRAKRLNSFTRLTYQHFILPEGKSTNAELLISASANKINSNFTTRAVSYSNSRDIYSELSITCRLPLNLRFTPLIQYEYTEKKLSRIKTELEKTFFNNGAINLTYEKNTITRSHLFSIGIRLNLSMMTSAFSAVRNGNTSTFMQSAGGSFIYDGRTKYKSFSKNFSLGRAALSVVAFLDLNNNGERDSKEPAIPGLKFSINGGRVTQDEKGNITRVSDLEAYRTYFLEVDSRSFDNLSWRVKNKTIAVETDPNHVKLIEVPVSVISEASGYVYIKTPRTIKGLSRMIVNFYAGDTLLIGRTLTEQDGFFSFMGLTPGSYIAALDTAQLHLLDFEAVPVSISFTIANSEEGVIADGFQFTVISHKNEVKEVKQANHLQPELTDSVNQEKYPQSSIPNKQKKKPTDNIQNNKTLKPFFRPEPKKDLSKQYKQIKKSPVVTDTSVLRNGSIMQIHGPDSTGKSYLISKHDTNTLVKQQLVFEANERIGKNVKHLANKKEDPSSYLKKKAGRMHQRPVKKSSESKIGNTNANKNNEVNINKPKVRTKQVVSTLPGKVASKKNVPAKKKTMPETNDQRKKTVPSAEEQQKLIEQLQKLLKKARVQKAEMAFILSFDISEV